MTNGLMDFNMETSCSHYGFDSVVLWESCILESLLTRCDSLIEPFNELFSSGAFSLNDSRLCSISTL